MAYIMAPAAIAMTTSGVGQVVLSAPAKRTSVRGTAVVTTISTSVDWTTGVPHWDVRRFIHGTDVTDPARFMSCAETFGCP